MAFWVRSLDDYISHWISSGAIEYNAIGIQWSSSSDITPSDLNIVDDEYIKNNCFYSILIHAPSSSINYEFISYKKPSDSLYDQIKWIEGEMPRCTFKAMNDPYPWDREDSAKIVPVRISRATTDLESVRDFYVNIMEADIMDFVTSNMASRPAKSMFFRLQETQIELQFVQRPSTHTKEGFALEEYEQLLLDTHSAIINGPSCGVDRWFDNHYAYSTWEVEGLMDRVVAKLNSRGIVYRVFKSPSDHTSPSAKANLEYYGYDTGYGLSVVEPTGQTFQLGGYISDVATQKLATIGDPQWCYYPCPDGLVEGTVDPADVYFDSEDADYISPDNNKDDTEKWLSKSEEMQGIVNEVSGPFTWHHGAALLISVLLFGMLFVSYHFDKVGKESYQNPYRPLIQRE